MSAGGSPEERRARFARVRAIYEAALDLEDERRADFARGECAGDEALWAEVARLLGATSDDEFLSPPDPPSLAFAPPSVALETGTRLGEFTLEERLASGGMGEVWVALQEEPRRRVALKTLRGGFGAEDARRRFRFEAEVLARLSHPGIASILAAGTHTAGGSHSLPWFAMEYVEGGRPLVAWAGEQRLELHERLELFLQVCEAVQYGHGKGVIHRDLKPDNVLVDARGQARVIDFGIARAAERDETTTQLTQAGDVLGTLQCMAPEQLGGDPDQVDIRADVYALGAMLYELLCGRPPLSVANQPLASAIHIVLEQAPTDPRAVAPDLPADLSWVLLHALEKEPERRYSTVAGLAEDLRRFLAHEPVSAGPPTLRYLVKKWLRRHRTFSVAAGITAVVALGAGGIALESRASAREAHAALMRESVKLLDLRLADQLHELAARAESLYPCVPKQIPAFEAWIAEAEQLLPGLEGLHRTVEEAGAPEDPVDRWLWEQLREDDVVGRAFVAPDGALAAVRARLEEARGLSERSLEGAEARAAWERARASIASRADCPLYEGLELVPQLGLLPLRRNPESGLWEFWHLLSGERPQLGADGRWRVDERTGIVLVLIPGGRFRMGASEEDELANGVERPAHEVDLDAYFLAAHELTGHQWSRVHGDEQKHSNQPIERKSWHAFQEAARRLDLLLPTEAQWERAARAGTSTRWISGDLPPDFDALGLNSPVQDRGLPVGERAPNPWGVYDLMGNVREWCRDPAGLYSTRPPAPGDGAHLMRADELQRRSVRGGFFGLDPSFLPYATRPSVRWSEEPGNQKPLLGARLARALAPS